MLIEFTEPRIFVVRGNRIDGKQIEFEFHPGAENDVPDEDWEHLKKHSIGCRTYINQGKLKPVMVAYEKVPEATSKDGHASDEVALEDKFPDRPTKLRKIVVPEEGPAEPKVVDSMAKVDLSKMTATDAIDLVEKVYGESNLVRFEKQEKGRRGGPRKKVLQALDKQLVIMRTDPRGGTVPDNEG